MSTTIYDMHNTDTSRQSLLQEFAMELKFNPGYDEDLELYEPGGLHPVRLNDTFQNGRYVIQHKLGSGGSATVWLAKDIRQERYVALKIPTANRSKKLREVSIHRFLTGAAGHETVSIATLLDHFTIHGPNGQHECLVFDVYGPNLNILGEHMIKIRPDIAQTCARELASSLDVMHRKGLVFGDLSPHNILFGLQDISHWSIDTLYEKLGEPDGEEVIPNGLAASENPFAHAPEMTYLPVLWHSRDLDLLKPKFALTDLDDAVLTKGLIADSQEDKNCGVHHAFMAPEFAFMVTNQHTEASDVWALGCILYQAMIDLLGKVPTGWREKLRNNAPKIADDLHETTLQGQVSIEQKISRIGEHLPWITMTPAQRKQLVIDVQGEEALEDTEDNMIKAIDNPLPSPPQKLSTEEAIDFTDLLSKMLTWTPEDRISMGEVLKHPWLNKTHHTIEQGEPWISPFHWGWDPRPVRVIRCNEDGFYDEGWEADDDWHVTSVVPEKTGTPDHTLPLAETSGVVAQTSKNQEDEEEDAALRLLPFAFGFAFGCALLGSPFTGVAIIYGIRYILSR